MVKIILHCSASSFGNAALISRWHVQERGWSGIGYHYVILNGWITNTVYHPDYNGHIETGRPLDNDPVVKNSEVGAHVRGHNYKSVGICLIGNTGNFSEEQLNSSLHLVNKLERQFQNIQILQHSDLDENKSFCAGLDMEKWKQNYELYKELVNIPEGEFWV